MILCENLPGRCSGSWAFSTIQQLESDAIRHDLITPHETLSVQQVISCQRGEICRGGSAEDGFYYAQRQGVHFESDYPFDENFINATFDSIKACKDFRKKTKDENGKWIQNPEKVLIKIHKFFLLRSETEMIDFVKSQGGASNVIFVFVSFSRLFILFFFTTPPYSLVFL